MLSKKLDSSKLAKMTAEMAKILYHMSMALGNLSKYYENSGNEGTKKEPVQPNKGVATKGNRPKKRAN